MKNIILSSVSIKNILIYFFAGFLGALLFGAIFGLLGLLFPQYLGFPMIRGSEEFAMEAGFRFYCLLSIPFGSMLGVLATSRSLNYKNKKIHSFIAAFVLALIGLILRNYFDLFVFILDAIVSSIIITTVIIYFAKVKQSNVPVIK